MAPIDGQRPLVLKREVLVLARSKSESSNPKVAAHATTQAFLWVTYANTAEERPDFRNLAVLGKIAPTGMNCERL